MEPIGKKQYSESGVVVGLLLSAAGLYTSNFFFFKLAMLALVITLTVPYAYKPFAMVWFRLGAYASKFSSFILLSIIYGFVLVPISAILKITKKDYFGIRKFNKGQQSVFTSRRHVFERQDIIHPY